MPPPPVSGAAAGIGLAACDCVADGLALPLRVADGLTPGVLSVALGLGELLGEMLREMLREMLGDAEAETPGDNFGSVVGGDDEQDATHAEPARAAKATAVSLALNPVLAVVVRIFIGLLIPAADPRERRR